MKFLVSGAAAFVVALIAGTLTPVLLTPVRPAAPASAAARGEVHGGGNAPAPGVATDSNRTTKARAVADSAGAKPAASAASAPAVSVVPAAAASAVPVARPPRLTALTAGPVRIEARSYSDVAKILVNMKPAEAGSILARMSDENVEGILAQLGPRQAAVLLAQLPSDRAAALSLRLIQRGPRKKP